MNLTKELLTKEIPYLNPTDTGETTLALMEEYKVNHLPLVDNGKYLCLVSERDAYRMESLDAQLGKAWYFSPAVKLSGHLLEALERMASNHLSLIPVVGENNEYLGVITQSKLLEALSLVLGTSKPGAILVVELSEQDYSISDIARLVENNNAHIVNLSSFPSPSGNIYIAFKVNVEDADAIARSLERFNYKLVLTYMTQGVVDEVAQKRLQELFYYINM